MKKTVLPIALLALVVCIGLAFWLVRRAALQGIDIPEPPEITAPASTEPEPRREPPAESPVPPQAATVPQAVEPTAALPEDYGPISHAVTVIIGGTDKKSHKARIRAVWKLGRNLERGDIEVLYDWLGANAHDQKDMTVMELNSVKNQALDKLLEQGKLPHDLGAKMVEMFRSDGCDKVWRDYCVQHFSEYYTRKWPPEPDSLRQAGDTAPGKPTEEIHTPERRMLQSACWEAVDLTAGTIGGTALLCLERLSERYPEFEKEEIARTAFDVAGDSRTGAPTKTTAIQVAGRMGNPNALALARDLAVSGDNLALRLSSIATIGYAGQKEDAQFLKKLLNHKDSYVRKAAASALKRLEKRL